VQRLSLLAVIVAAFAQQPPTFRANVEAVALDVSVLDAHRKTVSGLSAEDFTILEDGQPRPIVAFAAVGAMATSA
jgi:hypothetical protein